jgi:hypothetical protein
MRTIAPTIQSSPLVQQQQQDKQRKQQQPGQKKQGQSQKQAAVDEDDEDAQYERVFCLFVYFLLDFSFVFLFSIMLFDL